MNKLMSDLVSAFAQALRERNILYKLDGINLCENKEESTVSYDLFGTGKSPLDKNLLDIYNSSMLFQFRPEDIKLISTAATLLMNRTANVSLKGFDFIDMSNPTVTFSHSQTNQLYKYRLRDIEKKPELLSELGVDGYSAYIVANHANGLK